MLERLCYSEGATSAFGWRPGHSDDEAGPLALWEYTGEAWECYA